MKKYLQLNDLSSYKLAFNLSNYVWDVVIKWDFFVKDTVGKQFVRAIDSISANIAEGFGRYGKRDKVNFYRYSYGSIKECFDWNEKARIRYIFDELQKLPKEVNSLILYTNTKLKV